MCEDKFYTIIFCVHLMPWYETTHTVLCRVDPDSDDLSNYPSWMKRKFFFESSLKRSSSVSFFFPVPRQLGDSGLTWLCWIQKRLPRSGGAEVSVESLVRDVSDVRDDDNQLRLPCPHGPTVGAPWDMNNELPTSDWHATPSFQFSFGGKKKKKKKIVRRPSKLDLFSFSSSWPGDRTVRAFLPGSIVLGQHFRRVPSLNFWCKLLIPFIPPTRANDNAVTVSSPSKKPEQPAPDCVVLTKFPFFLHRASTLVSIRRYYHHHHIWEPFADLSYSEWMASISAVIATNFLRQTHCAFLALLVVGHGEKRGENNNKIIVM